jgi:ABC-type polysaccharide/polyol phosphate export permease
VSSDGRKTVHEWVVNEAPKGRWPALALHHFWTNRELIGFFALRDLRVRYKQAFLGVAWAGIQPAVGALMFTILFHRLADVQTTASSYFAFAMVGFGAWTYFSSSLHAGTSSLLGNSELLTKVSFPRIVPPAAALLPGFLDLAVALLLATAINIGVGGGFSAPHLLIGLPLGVLLLWLGASGPVLLLSATVVKYRDAYALLAFGLQFLLFASPIAYPPEFVPEPWRTLLYVNPVAGAVGLLRSALVDATLPPIPSLVLSGGAAAAGFLLGLLHFRRSELEFADII